MIARRLLPAAALALGACASSVPYSPPAPVQGACPVTACPACAAAQVCPPTSIEQPKAPTLTPVTFDELPDWRSDDHTAALRAFRASCPALIKRAEPVDWREVCARALALAVASPTSSRLFFESNFVPQRVANADGTTTGLITGYYEPLLHGSRVRTSRYAYPLYTPPDDLLDIELVEVNPDLKGMRLRGRLEGRRVVPYFTRAEIESGRAAVAGREIVWVDDAIELFFLQVQGSGRVQLVSGQMIRVGYADQNGQPYRSIGRYLVDRGELTLEQASMQGIQAWARAHPRQRDELLNTNPSYVFFRETPIAPSEEKLGPRGTLAVPLTPERSIAVDARSIPLGAPVFLATTRPSSSVPLNRLMVAQDTGGAIRGAVRADFFWGFGAEAAREAGRMRQQGQLWVLLPKARN